MTYVPKDQEAWAAKMAAWAHRQREVVHLREHHCMSFTAIGELLGVKKQRAAQLYIAAKNRQIREMNK